MTADELNVELKTLKRLEGLAQGVLHSVQDTKWVELRRILKDDMLRDAEGHRRKLIVFTEARDTLEYLQEKISNYLGMPDAVAVIPRRSNSERSSRDHPAVHAGSKPDCSSCQ